MAQNEEALAAGKVPDCVVAGRVDTLETASYRALLQGLHHCLEHWVELNSRRYDREVSLSMAKEVEPYLRYFIQDNSKKSPEGLAEVAACLSPGGVHNSGLLASIIRANCWYADRVLLAAILYYNWFGGKVGFQFLPDPAKTELEEYEWEVDGLILDLDLRDPRRILVGEDRDFYDSLPDTFTVYRGCAGVSLEHARAGICWSTKRDIAEWFADRSADRNARPVLISARVRKANVRLTNAAECEVVAIPTARFRALKCRPVTERPVGWTQAKARARARVPSKTRHPVANDGQATNSHPERHNFKTPFTRHCV